MTYVTHLIDSLCHHGVSNGPKHAAGDLGHSEVHCSEFSHQLPSLPSCQPNAFQSLDDRALTSLANRLDFNSQIELEAIWYMLKLLFSL